MPGGTILYGAHQDLEVFALDHEVLRTELAQQRVSGQVTMELAPGYCRAIARKASKDGGALYNEQLVSMDAHGGYVPQESQIRDK